MNLNFSFVCCFLTPDSYSSCSDDVYLVSLCWQLKYYKSFQFRSLPSYQASHSVKPWGNKGICHGHTWTRLWKHKCLPGNTGTKGLETQLFSWKPRKQRLETKYVLWKHQNKIGKHNIFHGNNQIYLWKYFLQKHWNLA